MRNVCGFIQCLFNVPLGRWIGRYFVRQVKFPQSQLAGWSSCEFRIDEQLGPCRTVVFEISCPNRKRPLDGFTMSILVTLQNRRRIVKKTFLKRHRKTVDWYCTGKSSGHQEFLSTQKHHSSPTTKRFGLLFLKIRTNFCNPSSYDHGTSGVFETINVYLFGPPQLRPWARIPSCCLFLPNTVVCELSVNAAAHRVQNNNGNKRDSKKSKMKNTKKLNFQKAKQTRANCCHFAGLEMAVFAVIMLANDWVVGQPKQWTLTHFQHDWNQDERINLVRAAWLARIAWLPDLVAY